MRIIEQLHAAAEILREHSQYTDDEFEHNGEGLAAQTCEDASVIITDSLQALSKLIDACVELYDGQSELYPDLVKATENASKIYMEILKPKNN